MEENKLEQIKNVKLGETLRDAFPGRQAQYLVRYF